MPGASYPDRPCGFSGVRTHATQSIVTNPLARAADRLGGTASAASITLASAIGQGYGQYWFPWSPGDSQIYIRRDGTYTAVIPPLGPGSTYANFETLFRVGTQPFSLTGPTTIIVDVPYISGHKALFTAELRLLLLAPAVPAVVRRRRQIQPSAGRRAGVS